MVTLLDSLVCKKGIRAFPGISEKVRKIEECERRFLERGEKELLDYQHTIGSYLARQLTDATSWVAVEAYDRRVGSPRYLRRFKVETLTVPDNGRLFSIFLYIPLTELQTQQMGAPGIRGCPVAQVNVDLHRVKDEGEILVNWGIPFLGTSEAYSATHYKQLFQLGTPAVQQLQHYRNTNDLV